MRTIADAFRLLRDDHAITSGNSDALAAIEQIEASHAALVKALRKVLFSACMHPSELDGEGHAAIEAAEAALAQARGDSDA